MRTRAGLLSAAAYAGMFVFGIVMALLGAVLPALSDRLQFDAAGIGTLFLAMNAAMLVCSLVLGFAMDRFGMKPPLALGPLLVAIALMQIARAGAFDALIPAVIVLGVGGGALNGATNTLVADLHEDAKEKGAALNLLGVFFGFGALLLPFTIGALLAKFAISALLTVAALLCAFVGVLAAVLRFPPPKHRHSLPWREMARFARSPLVLVMSAVLFFQSGVEFTMGGFISTYLTRGLGQTVTTASYILAAYWAALMLARVGLSRVLLGADPYIVVRICAVCASAGSLLVALVPHPVIAVAGILFAGLSLSGIFPTMLGIAGSHYPRHSGSVFGILFTCALSGGMTLPWVAGRVGQTHGLEWVFAVVACAFAAIAALSAVMRRCQPSNAGVDFVLPMT